MSQQPLLAELVDKFSNATGCVPKVDPTDDAQKWMITVSSPRVVMTYIAHVASDDDIHSDGSTLTIDGKPVPLARGIEELGAIFANPDIERVSVIDPMPPTGDPRTAPAAVQHRYGILRRYLESHGAQVRLGKSENKWIVGVDFPHDTAFRLYFAKRRRRWQPDFRRPMQLVIAGEDYTDEVDGDMQEAIRLLLNGSSSSVPSAPPSIGSPGGGAHTSKSVEVRTTTVIRR